jgi:bacillithiol biosynthesis deacetylase BshB1
MDLLVFGPHPDDIEIGLGGTIARHVALGYSVGLCDLTAGELGSNGTPEQRVAEAEKSRVVLGAVFRENLRLPDGQLDERPAHVEAIARLIRRWQPRTVAVPADRDRHPDHVAASRLLTRGVFAAGLRRFETSGEVWRPDWVCYYFINDANRPSFLVDVSDYYDVKRRALECHESQFAPVSDDSVRTRLTSSRFRQLIESRDAQFGALAGVAFAEGIVVNEPVLRSDLFKQETGSAGQTGEGGR